MEKKFKKNNCSEYIEVDDLFSSSYSVLALLWICLFIRYSLTHVEDRDLENSFLFVIFFHLLHPFHTGPPWLYLMCLLL